MASLAFSTCSAPLTTTPAGGSAAPTPAASAAIISSPVTPTPPGGSAAPTPAASAAIVVGPVDLAPPSIDPTTDQGRALAALEADDLAGLRAQADFAGRVGAGWTALSDAADAALLAGIRSLANELGVDPPVSARDRRLASVAGPPAAEPRQSNVSTAAAMAIVMAAGVAGQALGSSGTREAASLSSQTTTDGDEGATMSVKMTGKVAGSGSRVTADFTFELSGQVVNRVTGATATLTGRAAAHVEIDGCPDANGSTKGRLVLTSGESVTGGQDGGSASWTRDLQGTFDISVDEGASISGLVLDVSAQETVKSGTASSPSDHELGAEGHWEYGSGQGFNGLATREGTTRGSVTHQQNATVADLTKLFQSAAQSISAAAILLGTEAERFWRAGKCVEVLVDPQGGDVDPDSVTDVIAKVRHRFENRELDKPVEATLVGVKAIDPAAEKQPAPAIVKFTAGSNTGDAGEITFKTVSNRGIGKTTVRFTVRPAAWLLDVDGLLHRTDPGLAYKWDDTLKARQIYLSSLGGRVFGSGPVSISVTWTFFDCSATYERTQTLRVDGSRQGDDLVLRFEIPDSSELVTVHCPEPIGSSQVLDVTSAIIWGETLGEVRLPSAGGPKSAKQSRTLGTTTDSATGEFTVTVVPPQ